jgi:hypothetical protein
MALKIHTVWPEDLWSGRPQKPPGRPCASIPIERPFTSGAVAGGRILRTFYDLDRAPDRDLTRRLRDLRDDPRGYSPRTGRVYPHPLRQFRVLGEWGSYVRRIPHPSLDPWATTIKAFLADKRIVATVDVWGHGCPPTGRRHAFQRIAPIMRLLGWRRWRTDWGGVWVSPESATPKRRDLQRPTCYLDGRRRSEAARAGVTTRPRPNPRQLDLDRREAALAAWIEEKVTSP